MCLIDSVRFGRFDVVGNVAYSRLPRSAEKTGLFVHLRHLESCG
jgi:hypothetical protein